MMMWFSDNESSNKKWQPQKITLTSWALFLWSQSDNGIAGDLPVNRIYCCTVWWITKEVLCSRKFLIFNAAVLTPKTHGMNPKIQFLIRPQKHLRIQICYGSALKTENRKKSNREHFRALGAQSARRRPSGLATLGARCYINYYYFCSNN